MSCALTIVILFATEGYAQFDKMGLNTEWKKGSIVFEDNSTLEGLIQFNDKLGMIKFKEFRRVWRNRLLKPASRP